MSDSRVRIGTCCDAAEAAMVKVVLDAHDISVHISGENHAALLGAGVSAVEQVIWVPAEDAEQATALLREMREGGEAALADDQIPEEDDAERADAPAGEALVTTGTDTLTRLGKPKRIALAVIVGSLFGFGLAHLSTRAFMRGLALAVVQVVGWQHLAAGNRSTGIAMLIGSRIADVGGAIWEILRTRPPIAPAVAMIRKS